MPPDLALYIHWPFCLRKCPYCDFNSHAREAIDQARWRRALLRELAHFAAETAGRRVASVFFGGGTPSLMEPETVDALIAAVRGHWPAADDPEITLEANPSSVEAGRFRAFGEAGVNRLSVGVQSFEEGALRFLGRTHGTAEAVSALSLAAAHFPRYSFDLIYARPGQTAAAWRAELGRALAHAGGHLSLYQLTIEPGTGFHRDGVEAAPEDAAAALYDLTQEMLAAAGLPAYEVSNHARPGDECRHNLAGWRGGDYLGVGPGAHGRLAAHDDDEGAPAFPAARTDATRQIAKPEAWLAAVEAQGHGTASRTRLSLEERQEEILMTGLRLKDGLRADDFRRLTGRALEDVLDPARLDRLVGGGFLVLDAAGLRATAAGRMRLNAVTAALLA